MKTEKTLFAFFIIGVIIKFTTIPGSAITLVISLGTLSLLYLPGAFYFFSDKNIKTQNLPLSIIGGLFLSLTPMGILFKLLYWPASFMILTTAIASACILLLVAIILKLNTDASSLQTYYKNIILRTSILTTLSIALYFTPSTTIMGLQYASNPELARLKIQAFKNRDNEAYQKELYDYQQKHQ